ncbi:TonB-dependent receptor [uncultured Algimonas sp.]|uniref:TonB-dependent receptor n=1 Tax=uncultured Algimonas sp. TaxID=1547920 RepID=UPI002603F74F|nr:TonB-dependent receptor [uncultured Algimonas sp.]
MSFTSCKGRIRCLSLAPLPALLLSGASALAQAPGSGDLAVLDEVIVTGQKIERTLQETKESIAVLGPAQLDDLVLLDLEDAFAATANVYSFNGDQSFGLRGITQSSFGTGGGAGELAQLYIDEVAYTGLSNRFGPKDLWDVERIEILRGPQSTNVGRNALAGAVKVTTARPQLDGFSAAVRGQIGNAETYSAEGMVNLPLTRNLALRVTAEHFESDGFVTNAVRNEDDYDDQSNQTYRAKLLWEPTDALSVLLMGQYADTSGGEDLYRADLTGSESRESVANLDSFDDYEALSAALDISYAVDDRWTLRSITAFLDGDYIRRDDDDLGPGGGQAFRGRILDDSNITQDLRLNYEGERLRGVVGAYFADIDIYNDSGGLVNIAPANLGVPELILPFYPDNFAISPGNLADTQTRNYALFAEADYDLTDRLRLTAGLRYDNEEQSLTQSIDNRLLGGAALPDPANAAARAEQLAPGSGPQVFAFVTGVNARLSSQLTPVTFPETSLSFDAFLPQLGLTYDLSDSTTIAGFYKRGYRAGGVEVNSSGEQDFYDPEFLDNFELALRHTGAGGRLVLNANAYYGIWTDQQIRVPQDGNIFNTDVQNAGESTIAGVEVDARLRANDRTTLYASVGYALTQFETFCLTGSDTGQALPRCEVNGVIGADLQGNDFAMSPDITASLGGRFDITDRLYVSGSANYRDGSFSNVENTRIFANEGVMLLNLKAGYATDDFEVALFGRNITDESYTTFRGAGIGGRGQVIERAGSPTEYGILLTKRFGA